jgi:L-fuculose-phosphate aldolase
MPNRKDDTITKEDFCRFCRILYESRLVTGVGGNLSVRVEEGIWVTPSGYSLRDITPDRVVMLDRKGRVIGDGIPTKDRGLHLGVMEARPDVNVVCHVHGAEIISLTSLLEPGPDVLPPLTPGFVYYAYPLAMIPFYVPGSKALADAAAEYLIDPSRKALLLQSHGLVTIGEGYETALNIAEEIDEAVRIHILTKGKAKVIREEDVRRIKAL